MYDLRLLLSRMKATLMASQIIALRTSIITLVARIRTLTGMRALVNSESTARRAAVFIAHIARVRTLA